MAGNKFLKSIIVISILSAIIIPGSWARRIKASFPMRYLDFVERVSAGWVNKEIDNNPLYIKLQGGHLNHSRQLILKAAELALAGHSDDSPKRVLVIGAGNCLDIPLKELTDMFDDVYLLDIAYETTAAIADTGIYYELQREEGEWEVEKKYLTEEEREKLHFVLADATGGVAFKIVNRVEELIQKPTVTQEDVLKIPQNIPLDKLPFEGNYFDLITSSTVLSDFLTLAEDYMIHRLNEKDASFYVNSPEMKEELIRLNEIISKHHISEAHRLLKDNGRFYISASRFMGTIFHPLGGNGGKAGEFLAPGEYIHHLTREVSMPEDLTTLVDDYFIVNPSEQDFLNLWLWPIDNNVAIGIQALILSKREDILSPPGSDYIVETLPTSELLETVRNIYDFRHSLIDMLGHYTFGLFNYFFNEGLYIVNRRLRSLMKSEFKNKGIEFGDQFVPHLYATTPVLLNRDDLRRMFFGNEKKKIDNIVLNGDIVFTRLVRIANDTCLNDVNFKAAVYVGRGWHLENVYAERAIFSDGVTPEGIALRTDLSNIEVIRSYVGAGSQIGASVLRDAVVPEGRIFEKKAEIRGVMNEEIVLADYLSSVHEKLDLMQLLSGNINVIGSDINDLPYAGKITSLATAFCLLLTQNEDVLVKHYLDSLPEEIENDIKERMKIISVFVGFGLYRKLENF